MKKFLFIVLFFQVSLHVVAQTIEEASDDIRKKTILNKTELAKLKLSESYIKPANQLISAADKINKRALKIKKIADDAQKTNIKDKGHDQYDALYYEVIKRQIEADKYFDESNKMKFDVYKDHFANTRKYLLGNDELLKKVEKIEKDATLNYDEAMLKRKKAGQISDFEDKWALLLEASEMEKQAIAFMEKAYKIYQNWQVVDLTKINPPTINDKMPLYSFYRVTTLEEIKAKKLKELSVKGIDSLKRILTKPQIQEWNLSEKNYRNADSLMFQADAVEEQIRIQRNLSQNSADDNIRENARKKVEKLEDKLINIKTKAISYYEQANKYRHKIYTDNIDTANAQYSGSDKLKIKAEVAQDFSNDLYEEAQSIKLIAKKMVRASDSYPYLEQALDMERLALAKLEEAYDVYLRKKISSEYLAEFSALEDSTGLVKEEPTDSSETTTSDSLLYRIQIAADHFKIPDTKLKMKYDGDLEIVEEFADNIFRYVIGNFDTYNKAKEYITEKELKYDAFIVPYSRKTNQRLSFKSLKH